jgi:hypothetical protein
MTKLVLEYFLKIKLLLIFQQSLITLLVKFESDFIG